MNEEVKIKISQPMFEVGELETFDSNIHSIIEEYSKMLFKEKDQILTQRIIMKQEEEIERLNNIIKEVREFVERYLRLNLDAFDTKSLLEKVLEILDKGE